MRPLLTFCLLLSLWACTSAPKGVEPVKGFELERYLGTWFEIARLDHSFERGLSRVTANYRLADDGGVKVINRGYNAETGKWQEAEGKAYFVKDRSTGHLKVSFFGPFYGAYIIVALDKDDYQYALVSGPDREYLWILARQPALDQALLDKLLARARELGYPTDKLIWVEHPQAEEGDT